jgi:hypothetical protein
MNVVPPILDAGDAAVPPFACSPGYLPTSAQTPSTQSHLPTSVVPHTKLIVHSTPPSGATGALVLSMHERA